MNEMDANLNTPARVLVIESDAVFRRCMLAWLEEDDATVASAGSVREGMTLLASYQPEVVICAVRLSDGVGLDILSAAHNICPDVAVIMTASVADSDIVAESLRQGAADYLFTPVEHAVMLLHAVRRAVNDVRLLLENQRFRQALESKNRKLDESLRVLRDDQEAGRAVQLKILPPSSKTYGPLELNFRIKPSLYLSGDFVDHFRVSETQIGFYLADVSGHGASSAFVTIMLKTMANRLRKRYQDASRRVLLPAEILSRANEEMLSMSLGKHLSVFCGLIDFSRRQLVYSSASHFPPPRLFMSGNVHTLEAQGLPVGLFDNPGYQNRCIELTGDFELWACSDGALEVLEEPTLAEKEAKLVEIMVQSNHNVDTFLSLLGVTEQGSVPDDIAVLQVSGRC